MNRGLESVRHAMQFGIDNDKQNMLVYLEELKQLFEERDALLKACRAFHIYWTVCALKWKENDGVVGMTVEGSALVVGEDLDKLAENAAQLVISALKRVEEGEKEE